MLTASIVINTYNRARSLERLLPSLDHLHSDRFEVIIVDGPSTDDTQQVLSRYRQRVKTARCETPNLSRSRNIGVAAAAGDVVVFIDDDALPAHPLWLERLIGAFEEDTEGSLGAAGGASIHRDSEWPEFSGGWTSDYAEQRFTGAEDPHKSTEPGASRRWFRRTVGNNSAFRRSALVAIGGFDEHYPYYLDEADVCLRLTRAGYRVRFLDDAAVRHYPASSPVGPPFIRNRRLIARSDTYYALKNGSDSLPRRILRTVVLAPRKHFVRELPGLVANGTISTAVLWRLRAQLLRGVAEGLALGLTARRATSLREGSAPGFLRYRQAAPARQLSVALLSRRLPPDPHAGGVGRYTYDLACGLHERGHRVTIITESETPLRHERLGLDIVGVRPSALPRGLAHTPVLAQNLAYAEAVVTCIRALLCAGESFDLVHVTNWGMDGLGLLQWQGLPVALMLVTPLESVIEAEGWTVNQDLAANIDLDQWMVERADRVLAPSLGVVSCYARRPAWSGRIIHPVALGSAPAPAAARAAHPNKRLLFVGRLEKRKGIHVLLDVLPRLLEHHPQWECDLVGNNAVAAAPGATFESLFFERHARAPWIDRIRFHGPVSDAELPRFYANADVFVAPSLFESFGLIYLEAMQHGVPVVGTRVGGVPDVVTDGVDGLLVPPGDREALAGALGLLMSDENLRRRLGTAAAETVRASRSHLGMADRLIAEYGHTIAAHAAKVKDDGPAPDAGGSVADHAVRVLDSSANSRGLSLAYRAAAAYADGDRSDASDLMARALTLSAYPDYFAMAVEWALNDDDVDRALTFARHGFQTTCDDSDVCLAFAACLLRSAVEVSGLDAWCAARSTVLPGRLFGGAVAAIRVRRDGTAIVLLEACLAVAKEGGLKAQAHYHLGSTFKRRNRIDEARRHFNLAQSDNARHLPAPLGAALHFHLGELDLTAGSNAAAMTHFLACLELNPEHARARLRLDEARAATAAA